MKPSLILPIALFAGALNALHAQGAGFAIEAVEPVEPISPKPLILPFEEVTEEEATDDEWVEDEPVDEEETEEDGTEDEEATGDEPEDTDPGPDDWLPGGWDPDWVRRGGGLDVIYTMTGGESPTDDEEDSEDEPDPEIDPVIYQTGVPVPPKVSAKEKRADLQADIVDGCIVTYGAWDLDGNGALDLTEFSARWPGRARPSKLAFKRIDKNRDGLITAGEFSVKKPAPLVMPKSMGILEASEYRMAFNLLDFDGNGFLTFGEFTAVLRPSGPGILEAIFAEADQNGDGKISFAEYTHRPVNPAGVE